MNPSFSLPSHAFPGIQGLLVMGLHMPWPSPHAPLEGALSTVETSAPQAKSGGGGKQSDWHFSKRHAYAASTNGPLVSLQALESPVRQSMHPVAGQVVPVGLQAPSSLAQLVSLQVPHAPINVPKPLPSQLAPEL